MNRINGIKIYSRSYTASFWYFQRRMVGFVEVTVIWWCSSYWAKLGNKARGHIFYLLVVMSALFGTQAFYVLKLQRGICAKLKCSHYSGKEPEMLHTPHDFSRVMFRVGAKMKSKTPVTVLSHCLDWKTLCIEGELGYEFLHSSLNTCASWNVHCTEDCDTVAFEEQVNKRKICYAELPLFDVLHGKKQYSW